jgi:hypothetical protein
MPPKLLVDSIIIYYYLVIIILHNDRTIKAFIGFPKTFINNMVMLGNQFSKLH